MNHACMCIACIKSESEKMIFISNPSKPETQRRPQSQTNKLRHQARLRVAQFGCKKGRDKDLFDDFTPMKWSSI